MSSDDANDYVLGHSDRELERLRRQAQLVDPITRQYLIEAGIASGMRVLDIGSGAGDVSFLAADLVGHSGQVVGVDRSPDALALARSRAKERSLANVSFQESELSAMAFDQLFDAAIGRYVLCFQTDPVALLRKIARLVRPGASSCSTSPTASRCVHIRRRRPMTIHANGSMKPIAGLGWM
jgi:ubiquinone/menaquinone biosynthesis C-methylase UbiE